MLVTDAPYYGGKIADVDVVNKILLENDMQQAYYDGKDWGTLRCINPITRKGLVYDVVEHKVKSGPYDIDEKGNKLEKKKAPTYTVKDQGTGELTTYPDTFAEVTEEQIAEADRIEGEIKQHVGNIETSYINLAKALDEFDRKQLYLAKGAPSFFVWLKSNTELGISYRTAHDLIRIVREVLPIMLENDRMNYIPPVSKMRALLPTLADGPDVFLQALDASRELTVSDTYDTVKELRGEEISPYDNKPFRAVVHLGKDMHMVKIYSTDPDDQYTLGILKVKKTEWAKFERTFEGQVLFEGKDSRQEYDAGDDTF